MNIKNKILEFLKNIPLTKILLLLACVVISFTAGAASPLIYQKYFPQSPTPQPTLPQKPTPTQTNTNSQPSSTQNKHFFTMGNNIYSTNISTQQIQQETNYPRHYVEDTALPWTRSSSKNQFQDIKIIDDQTIGFVTCQTRTGDFGCTIQSLDLPTHQQRTLYKGDPSMLIDTIGFHNQQTFAFLSNWTLYLIKNNQNIILDQPTATNNAGRGGILGDSNKISFSPQGDKLFNIHTSNPRSSFDDTIRIYNLSGQLVISITDATQPSWINNQQIVYRHTGANPGLYIYDITSQSKTPIPPTLGATYSPSYQPQTKNIVYENFKSKQVWLYNLETKQNKLLIKNALHSRWLTPNHIIYNPITICNDNEPNCGSKLGNYQTEPSHIYNLNTNTNQKLNKTKESFYYQ